MRIKTEIREVTVFTSFDGYEFSSLRECQQAEAEQKRDIVMRDTNGARTYQFDMAVVIVVKNEADLEIVNSWCAAYGNEPLSGTGIWVYSTIESDYVRLEDHTHAAVQVALAKDI